MDRDRERPPVMVPVSEETAAVGMLIDEQRRMRATMDKVNDTLVAVMQQLARMDAEAKHMIERRTANEKRLDDHDKRFEECETRNDRRFGKVEGRVDGLEDWKLKTEGARDMVGGILKHPLATVVLNILASVLIAALVIIVGTRLGL